MSATDEGRRPFAAWLQEQQGGVFHAELGDALADIVAGVTEHERGGTLTIKVTVKPEADGAVKISTDFTAKVPRAAARPSLFFADSKGNLSRRNPRQPELPLRGIPGGGNDDPQAEEANQA